MPQASAFPLTLMEAGFKIIPGKEAEFFEVQNRMVPIGMSQPGFVAVYGGPIAASDWLYFSVRFASPQEMHAWHQQRGHQAVQRKAYEQWWTAMYIRKWQRPRDDVYLGDRFLCETRIERETPLSDADTRALEAELARLAEFGVQPFETSTGQYEPQPHQFVGPLEMAPASAPATYALVTHWSSSAALARWQDSGSYRALQALGKVTSETFVPYAEPEERAYLRHDRLQRDWTLGGQAPGH
jgi:heme-degrading monooxygenase HmoA